MSNLWFRVYDSALDDPRLPAGTFRTWFNLLCAASRCGGTLPQISELAFLLRTRQDVLLRRLEALKVAGLVEEVDGALRPTDWQSRQFVGRDGPGEPLSGAERTKRWRERRDDTSARDAAPAEPVTGAAASEEDQEEETDSDSARDGFAEFWRLFPKRAGDNPIAPARAAYRAAIAKGAPPLLLVAAARAYAAVTADRPPKFIVSAVRWLNEDRWRNTAQTPNETATESPGVWIQAGSPEWAAWSEHYRNTKGKSPPLDGRGGWRFPAKAPPAQQTAAA